MMNVCPAHVQKQIRHPPGHNQNDEGARRDESEKKRNKNETGKVARRSRWQNGSLRHLPTVNENLTPRLSNIAAIGVLGDPLGGKSGFLCRGFDLVSAHA